MIRFSAFWTLSATPVCLATCLALAACSDESGSERDPSGTEMASGNLSDADESTGEGSEVAIVDPADRTPRPSAGCQTGDASPPTSVQTFTLSDGSEGTYFIFTPPGYAPSEPQALGFVFHGAGQSPATCRGGSNCPGVARALEPQVITVYMQSFGSSWTDAERDHNVQYFDELFEHVKASYCVDERRVFAVGTSSGAHFSNILGCRRPNELMAIVPGAGERLEKTGCQPGRFAALVLHGVDDPHVPFPLGEEARDFYAMQNGCSMETAPALGGMHDDVRAARDARESSYGCVDFVGCDEGLPVRWCEHSEGGYDDTTHGWPSVGGQLAWDFVSSLF